MSSETQGVRRTAGDDFEAFEAGVEADPTAEAHSRLAAVGDRRLYSVTLSESATEAMTYTIAAEHDITYLDVRADATESRVRALVPDREALSACWKPCQEWNRSFRLLGLSGEAAERGDGCQFDLILSAVRP